MAKELGDLLKKVRLNLCLSIRKAAERSRISNPYLSQLESGNFPSPSPRVLLKLAEAYNFSYLTLMKTAGYLPDIQETIPVIEAEFLSLIKDLSKKEKEEVLNYAKFVRSHRKN